MQNKIICTTLNLENEANVILSLTSKIKELQELKDERIAEVRSFMQANNFTELQAGPNHMFKISEITRNTVDSKLLKRDFADIYKQLLKVSSYFKFETI